MAALSKEEIIQTIKDHPTVLFLTTGNAKKQIELTRLVNTPEVPVLNLNDLAVLLDSSKEALESDESEKSYLEIATGKVEKAKQVALQSGLDQALLKKMMIVGDDYGAAAGALTFTYDASAPEFDVSFGEDGHIAAIRTNRQELDGQAAPGYFSKRVMKAVAARHPEVEDKFLPLADEILYAARTSGDHSTSATVAIAYGRPVEGEAIATQLKTASYILPDKPASTGFDFDRIQCLEEGGQTIAEWSDKQKDLRFPRGQAVRAMMADVRQQLSYPDHDGSPVAGEERAK